MTTPNEAVVAETTPVTEMKPSLEAGMRLALEIRREIMKGLVLDEGDVNVGIASREPVGTLLALKAIENGSTANDRRDLTKFLDRTSTAKDPEAVTSFIRRWNQ